MISRYSFLSSFERVSSVSYTHLDVYKRQLHNIATLNNAKVDLMPDQDCNWYVDYNLQNIDSETGLPVGTLKIPALLIHDNKRVGSRGILRKAQSNFKKSLIEIFTEYPKMLNSIGAVSYTHLDVYKRQILCYKI